MSFSFLRPGLSLSGTVGPGTQAIAEVTQEIEKLGSENETPNADSETVMSKRPHDEHR